MHSCLQKSEDHDTWVTIPSRFDSAKIRWDRFHFGNGLVACTQMSDFVFAQTCDSRTPQWEEDRSRAFEVLKCTSGVQFEQPKGEDTL